MDIRYAMNIIRKSLIITRKELAGAVSKTEYLETQHSCYAGFTVKYPNGTVREVSLETPKTDDYYKDAILQVVDSKNNKGKVVLTKRYEYTSYNDDFRNNVNKMKDDLKLPRK